MNDPMTFDNGLSPEHDEEIDNITIEINVIIRRINQLGPHRSYALSMTRLEEAMHWLRDRKSKAKNEHDHK